MGQAFDSNKLQMSNDPLVASHVTSLLFPDNTTLNAFPSKSDIALAHTVTSELGGLPLIMIPYSKLFKISVSLISTFVFSLFCLLKPVLLLSL